MSQRLTSLMSAALVAVVVGFASTILVVIEGARAAGANPAQQASVAASLCFAMAATSAFLAFRYKQPIIVAWSTSGSVLIATSANGLTYPEAIGAFLFAAALMILTGLLTPLSRAIARLPSGIAAAMLAGVLLRYVTGVPLAAITSPEFAVPLIFAYFLLRLLLPLYAVPIIVALGLVIAALAGAFTAPVSLGLTPLVFVAPEFNWQVMISLGLPLYLVTMASQNLPGFAVLRANGYHPPVSACLITTGVGSAIAAPFGSHAVNMAAITASIVATADAHPDQSQRWKMIYAYAPAYVVVALVAGTCVSILGALPKDLITALAGLSLFGPLLGAMSGMMQNREDLEPALVTFLVTASGMSVFGVGSAFWGLLAGLVLWMIWKPQR